MKITNLSSLLLASFSGKLIYALASLVSLPLAAHVLGAEAVGLVGFFTTLLMVLMVLEGGLTSRVIQRLASIRGARVIGRSHRPLFALVNTYLLVFAAMGLLAALVIVVASPMLVSSWLKLNTITQQQALYCLYCMAIFIGLNLPVMLLQGVFAGHELQQPLNKIYIPYSIMRTLGVLLVVSEVTRLNSVVGYFLVQVMVQSVYVLALLFVLKKHGVLGRARCHLKYLKQGIAFSRGVFLISLTSVVTVQYDKIFMSGSLGLDEYAYYSLASTVAGFPYIFSTAFNAVLFPRFSSNLRLGQFDEIEKIFRAALVLFSLVMTVMCSAVFWFAQPVLLMMFEPFLANGMAGVLPFLLVGTALQSLLIIPFALQLAASWTSLSFRLNLMAVPIMLLALPALVAEFGAVGGGYTWVLYNLFSLACTAYFTSRRFPWLKSAYRACLVSVLFTTAMANGIFFICSLWLNSGLAILVVTCLSSVASCGVGLIVFRRHLAGLR
ncbi:TPA: oligosaccharide flippase family protein [Pseudomonas putida]|uniref:oligosaccharide flippase family protein n=1 Tax=Pseudomonas putida TaxID=303 RepID=UPI00110D235D|nr:oligosaccharide flippase family protein [Pseudomonas putida]MDD1993795.1 oligosaccharide flippase family protein [Pseudomonas putida]HDS0916910.1 oligosaccharide flippase family protein [Pseudomonas putida]HDS0932551.1 oligosaccharide flippase family protein [Pseudomonas putida]HDS1782129.1 oligosaccharide flippase family protein [Pseudomonas putida]HDS3797939.1 oligosaccharide flippase family protein [Pseudomonas putida]